MHVDGTELSPTKISPIISSQHHWNLKVFMQLNCTILDPSWTFEKRQAWCDTNLSHNLLHHGMMLKMLILPKLKFSFWASFKYFIPWNLTFKFLGYQMCYLYIRYSHILVVAYLRVWLYIYLALYSAIGGENEIGKGGGHSTVDTGALAEERDPLQRHPDKSDQSRAKKWPDPKWIPDHSVVKWYCKMTLYEPYGRIHISSGQQWYLTPD